MKSIILMALSKFAPNIQHLTTSANEEAAQVYGSNRKQQPNTGKFNTGNV